MSGWVVDCSTALAWALPDEEPEIAHRLFTNVSADAELWVPALWWYELANGLLVAQRRKRLSEAKVSELMQLYGTLPLQTDSAIGSDALGHLEALAERFNLAAYDAAYLELAQRKVLGLATLDEKLAAAAKKAGVPVFS